MNITIFRNSQMGNIFNFVDGELHAEMHEVIDPAGLTDPGTYGWVTNTVRSSLWEPTPKDVYLL